MIRSLPTTTVPVPGESVPSYLTRLSNLNGIHPRHLYSGLAGPHGPKWDRASHADDFQLSRGGADAISRLSRQPTDLLAIDIPSLDPTMLLDELTPTLRLIPGPDPQLHGYARCPDCAQAAGDMRPARWAAPPLHYCTCHGTYVGLTRPLPLPLTSAATAQQELEALWHHLGWKALDFYLSIAFRVLADISNGGTPQPLHSIWTDRQRALHQATGRWFNVAHRGFHLPEAVILATGLARQRYRRYTTENELNLLVRDVIASAIDYLAERSGYPRDKQDGALYGYKTLSRALRDDYTGWPRRPQHARLRVA